MVICYSRLGWLRQWVNSIFFVCEGQDIGLDDSQAESGSEKEVWGIVQKQIFCLNKYTNK